jgi:thiol-disulfide isomerase/thioredoxin
MKQIKEDYKIDYLYVDASKLSKDDQKEILKVLDIEGSTPTIAVVKDDDVVDVNVGYMDGKDTVEFLKKNKILEEDATYKPEENLTFIDFNRYKELVSEDALNVIVIGQTTCSHCIAVKPVLSRVAGNNNITINYLNLTEMSQDEQSELIENLKSIGYSDADNLGTPLTLITKNNHLEGTIEGENPPSYFTREFKKYGVIAE